MSMGLYLLIGIACAVVLFLRRKGARFEQDDESLAFYGVVFVMAVLSWCVWVPIVVCWFACWTLGRALVWIFTTDRARGA